MAEEHRCEAPEGHRLCVNNCGFSGSPATMNLCSKCYRDFRIKEQQEASTKSTIEAALSSSSPSPSTSPIEPVSVSSPEVATDLTMIRPVVAVATAGSETKPNRCSACRKKVGLTGFRCRCGTTFCGTHRYPEKHGCSFDFKAMGREEIARANPLVKADKLERI